MISRRSAIRIADAYADTFVQHRRLSHDRVQAFSNADWLYDFLYERDFPGEFCDQARAAAVLSTTSTRTTKDFFMGLHRDVLSVVGLRTSLSAGRGQTLLFDLAEAIIEYLKRGLAGAGRESFLRTAEGLVNTLKLDGYEYAGHQLHAPDHETASAPKRVSTLEGLYRAARIGGVTECMHHLGLAERHFVAKRWDDSISNSRKVLETTLRYIAEAQVAAGALPPSNWDATRPVRVREFLEACGFATRNEIDVVRAVYGLTSAVGAHPHVARADQAQYGRVTAIESCIYMLKKYARRPVGQAPRIR